MKKSKDIDVNQIQTSLREYDDAIQGINKSPVYNSEEIYPHTKQNFKSKFSDWQKAQLDMFVNHKSN